jgi:hypothetical protein
MNTKRFLTPLLLGLFLASCSSPQNTGDTRNSQTPATAETSLRTLRLNDDGSLSNEEDLKQLCRDIAARPQTVVVFMHGWKGTAAISDSNVQNFMARLATVRGRTYQPGKRKLTGVYLTWNARSLPGFIEVFAYPETRARADTISQGDGIPRIIRALSKAQRVHAGEHFVVTGHSFGGRILGRAIGKNPELLSDIDLVLLANAADDADSGRRTISAVNSHPYQRRGLPRLVWVTSAKDTATGVLFKMAGGRPAIGHDKALQTHVLRITKPTAHDPKYHGKITRTANRLSPYAHNIIVDEGLGDHPDVWNEAMNTILNTYLLHDRD